MSIISFRESVAGSATEIILVEVGRPFLRTAHLSLFTAGALGDQVGLMILAQGQSILPMPTRGSDRMIWLENHFPVSLEVNKEINGPPYLLEITMQNPNAGAVILSGIFEVYSTPYPQTRIHVPPGRSREGLDPLSALALDVREKEAKKSNGT